MQYGPIGPVTVPRGTTTPKRVAIIVLAVVVLLGGLAFGLSQYSRNRSNYPPPPALPKVIADPVVTEAIDLFKKPKLGEPWNASGGAVPYGLKALPFVTPCGVLVTVVYSGYPTTDAQTLSQTRIVGYDIASGRQKWSHGLQQVTGLANPNYDSYMHENGTYSGDCHMVINFDDEDNANRGAGASLFIDLASGDVTTMAWTKNDRGSCVAAGASWAGCFKLYDHESMAFKLDGSTKPVWTEQATPSFDGDFVVAGFIFSDAGYRDPATGRVAFGADLATKKKTVMYVEPRRPGGYRSGLVVRVAGQMDIASGQCQINLLDPSTNREIWPTPGRIECGGVSYQWGVASQALVVTVDGRKPDPTTNAFGLSDGFMLWQRDGSRLGTPWYGTNYGDWNAISLSEAYLFLTPHTVGGYGTMAIRIADGMETNLSYARRLYASPPLKTVAGAMAYAAGYSGLTAYTIDANKPTSPLPKAWSIPSPFDRPIQFTFATGGVMYLLYDLREDGLQVVPLLS